MHGQFKYLVLCVVFIVYILNHVKTSNDFYNPPGQLCCQQVCLSEYLITTRIIKNIHKY